MAKLRDEMQTRYKTHIPVTGSIVENEGAGNLSSLSRARVRGRTWRRYIVYIILGDADIFHARPGTKHGLVASGLRHGYVYLTSNTTASCYTRMHAVLDGEREKEKERKSFPVRESPWDGGRRNRKFHLRRESFRDGNSSCSLTTCYLSRIIR